MWLRRARVVDLPLVVLLLAVGTLAVCRAIERPTTRAESGADPQIAELIDHGWIPADLIHPDATSIIETHDLDTNHVWLVFRQPASEPDVSSWRPIERSTAAFGPHPECNPTDWWDRELVEACVEGEMPDGWTILERPGARLAISSASSAVCYWSWTDR